MPIPDYQAIMLPLLKFAGDQQEHSLREATNILADYFKLTEEEKNELLPSGGEERFYNRVGWARTYLKKAELLNYPRRGFFAITPRGIKLLSENPEDINVKVLKQYDEFTQFIEIKNQKNPEKQSEKETLETPEEILESAHQKLQDNLSLEILENIKQCSPHFFESLVVDLLVSMGYGGSRKEAGQALRRSRDEGIDGIIKEDRLGLDIIYIQAKRWENVVGRPEIQKFAGALQGQRARKGIFITTSDFTKDAIEYVSKIETKIILLNGNRLTELMIEHNVGVTPIAKYEVKRIDSDYFIEE
ncbi:MAG: restriction endonuclease [Xenococcaceae cyanobacterium MO_188.B32]|nr:restriction endonuclease [Xenococcaceae cyanobacterium MO_188.B32]